VDLGTEDLGQKLLDAGYNRSLRTLFLMEGLIYYLSPAVVEEILSFISKNSGKGSSIIFDYFPRSIVDENSLCELGTYIRRGFAQMGEPLLFGIEEGMVESLLTERGFSQICNVTSEDYKRAYFHGVNEGRAVCDLMSFVHARIK
jgi:methyltransferase (TIGR00027 family)